MPEKRLSYVPVKTYSLDLAGIKGRCGVAVLVIRKHKDGVLRCWTVDERLMMIDIDAATFHFSVIVP